MTVFLAGLVAGVVLGVFFGLELARFPDAVRAVGIGFGAGIGIFILGALVRFAGGLVDKAVGRIKERQAG